jgi:hypothetical protein
MTSRGDSTSLSRETVHGTSLERDSTRYISRERQSMHQCTSEHFETLLNPSKSPATPRGNQCSLLINAMESSLKSITMAAEHLMLDLVNTNTNAEQHSSFRTALRLVSKECTRFVDSNTTKLTCHVREEDSRCMYLSCHCWIHLSLLDSSFISVMHRVKDEEKE